MTRARFQVIVAVLLAAVTFSGCAMTIDARALGVEATLASDASEPAVGEAFEFNKKAVYMFWGLAQPGKPSLRNIIASQVQGDARVADLSVRVRSRFGDVLISILTLGLVVPRTVTLEGVVVEGTGN